MWHSFLTCFSFMVSDFDISYFYSVSALAWPSSAPDSSAVRQPFDQSEKADAQAVVLCRARAPSSAACC
jgi:hypothetical protein